MKTAGLCIILLLMSALVLSGCSSGPRVRAINQAATLPAPDSISASGAYEGGSDYQVGAQDLLSITVFGVSALNRDVRVNSNGQISLPLIGGVQAGGRTIPQLEHDIEAKLSRTYLQNPQVSVFVKEYTSQRITLGGSLNKPGIYPITGKTSLLQAVAMAGGLDPLARQDGVVIFRQIKGKRMAAVFDLGKISSGQSEDPRVYGDDIIVVAKSGSKNSLQQIIKAAPALALFFLL